MNTQTKEKKITLTLSGDDIVCLFSALEVDIGTEWEYVDKDDPNCQSKVRIDYDEKLHARLKKAYDRWLKKNK